MILKAEAGDGNHEEPERKARRVLELEHSKAREFFLKGETFFDLDLPPYFKFDRLLASIARTLPSGEPRNWAYIEKLKKKESEELNHTVFNNRDGRYDWRPMQMVNPVLYVLLAREITEENHWESIRERFREFAADERIECPGLPVESPRAGGDKGERISAWWKGVEQRSIELALDYGNMIQTDITDCFGSIYTHSIAWAMHDREKARANRKDMKMLGNIIDSHVRRICGGQTNGIPQGCPLMNFVAEMVLGYADLQLSKKIRDAKIKDYRILRFRDDYRIFTDSPGDGETILKILTETMIGLGMRLNPSKTLSTGEIIRNGAIKPDKLFWTSQKQRKGDLQKHLLIIHDLASRFPNSGSLAIALDDYHKKVKKKKKPKNIKSLLPLISIVADIAYNNPRTYAISCAVISEFLEWTSDHGKQREIIEKIRKRFSRIPNTGHLEIWLQRLTVTFDRSHGYEEKLCKLVEGECAVGDIWDFGWIKKKKLVEEIEQAGIVDEEVIKKLPLAVSPEEVEVFKRY